MLNQFIDDIKSDSKQFFNKNFYFFLASFFFVLASYPFIRSTTVSIFIDNYGGNATPNVWLYSVVALTIIVFFYSKLYNIVTIKKLFVCTAIVTAIIFLVGASLVPTYKWLAYPLFIWKEVYIILLMHLTLAYFNENNDISSAKLLYGLIGAVGSIGGIIGGLTVGKLSSSISSEHILMLGVIPIAFTTICFLQVFFTKNLIKSKKLKAPLEAIQDVRKYIVLLILLLAVSQIIITLANFKFNVLLGDLLPTKADKTKYVSGLYTIVNMVALFIQILILPILLRTVSVGKIHFLIPITYAIAIFLGFFTFGSFFSISATFIFLKGSDYSIFNAARELLYFPLKKSQKTGAKYIIDMISYRGSKALVSVILIYVTTKIADETVLATIINIAIFVALICWIMIIFIILAERKKVVVQNSKETEL